MSESKDGKALELHLEGNKGAEIAAQLWPNQTKQAGLVSVSRALKRAKKSTSFQAVLKSQNITLERAIKPINDALEATKHAVSSEGLFDTGLADHNIRLRAGKDARELLGIDKSAPQELSREAIKISKDSDEVELQRAVFRKSAPPS